MPVILRSSIANVIMDVRRPEIPYMSRIDGGLPTGRKITIDGFVKLNAESFVVDLQQGPVQDEDGPIAFHFRPYFGTARVVVRNSLYPMTWEGMFGLGWGDEEDRGTFPFVEGHSYKIEIFCEQHCFIIYVNGNFFDFYNHRIPQSNITHLKIKGDTDILSVQVEPSRHHSSKL